MFYSQFILAKKGPLGTIWIAAHLERKLRKNQVADTDIGVSVDSILFPDVPIALRLSSHLLLGVVRIYSKKVSYLFDDCSDALLKVKQAFRSTAVDLPPEESTAPYHSITLPETFDLDDFELPGGADIFQGNYVDHHVSSREQITLQDTMEGVVFSTSQFGLDERFGDGDTSGLDLDELDNRDLNADMGGVEYAQAPCTPGLAEEPNMSSAQQEASVCDDHHNELEEDEEEEEPPRNFSKVHKDSEEEDCYNTTKLSTTAEKMTTSNNSEVVYSGKENGVMSGCSLQENDEENSAAAISDGQKKINPLPDIMSPACEYPPGQNFTTSLDDDGLNVLQNGVISNNDDQLGPKTSEEIDPAQDSNAVEEGNVEKSCPHSDSLTLNVESPTSRSCYPEDAEIRDFEDPNHPKVSSPIIVHEEELEVNADAHFLRPCKQQQHANQPSATIPEPNVPVSCPPPDSPVELQAEGNQSELLCNLNDNMITMEPPQLDAANAQNDLISDLPAPEIFLSLQSVGAHEDMDQVHHLLDSSTPNRENNSMIGDLIGDTEGTNVFISGKKRTFTESTLTMDSLNSIESFGGAVQSKRSKGSVPDDNDLLSSILVGRSSYLKLKPTPLPPERKTSKKRPRASTTTRIASSSSKRKVIVDETMVLNGDQIRQQLTHTGDIRRIRKKAPCTRAEIWMIRKEDLDEEEIFSEPIFTGFSSGLASLYRQEYDISDIKLSQNELTAQSGIHEALISNDNLDPNLEKEFEKEVNHDDSVLVRRSEIEEVVEVSPQRKQEEEEEEEEVPSSEILRPDGHSVDDIDINVKINSIPDAINNPTSVNGVESTFSIDDAVSVDKVDVPNSVQLHPSDPTHDQTFLETQFVEMEASIFNESNGGKVVVDDDATIIDEMHSRPIDEFQVRVTEEVDVSVSNGGENLMNDKDSRDGFLAGQGMEEEEFSKNWSGVVKEVENLEFDVDGQCPILYNSVIEPAEASTHHLETLDSECGNNNNFQNEMVPENAFVDYNATIDHDDFGYNTDVHDTGFLNEDDDEIDEEGEDCTPSAEQAGFIDNSGWSSRTRAVAKYLQVLFDKETEQGSKALPMNNLLIGKTRKEASRMFFEALVLKTRDYIHIEQEAPFENINMKPRVKLMKSDF